MIKNVRIQDKYIFYNDPGHAWLKVPAVELAIFGVLNKISAYSYIQDKYVYLEEDSDAGTFLKARFPGMEPREVGRLYIIDKITDNDSPIRDYAPYCLTRVAKLL
jgi:hypothetical protein